MTPPSSTTDKERTKIENMAREKIVRQVRARGHEPDLRTLRINWITQGYGTCSIYAFPTVADA